MPQYISMGDQLTFLVIVQFHRVLLNKRGFLFPRWTESKFKSMVEVAGELMWFFNIVKNCVDYKIIDKQPQLPTFFADNLSAIEFTHSPIENCRSKRINVILYAWIFLSR